MAFILSDERTSDPVGSFQRYRAYLEGSRDRLPAKAAAIAFSDWYFDASDHRCPHDTWLEELSIVEHSSGDRQEIRSTELRVRLLGAYHDGHIVFVYRGVSRLVIDAGEIKCGHRDWRYDEFRVSESGMLIHEIEWRGADAGARWLIEASDIEYRWIEGKAAPPVRPDNVG